MAAWMFLIRKKDFIAGRQIHAVDHHVVRFRRVAHQRKLVGRDVQKIRKRLTRLLQMRVFVVAKPRVGRLDERLGGKNMVNHRAQNGKRRAPDRPAIQVDVIGRKQPLLAQSGPKGIRIG